MHQFTLQTSKLFVGRSQGRSRLLLLLHCVSVLCWCENKMIIEPDVYSDLPMEMKCNKEYRTEHTKVLCKKKKPRSVLSNHIRVYVVNLKWPPYKWKLFNNGCLRCNKNPGCNFPMFTYLKCASNIWQCWNVSYNAF